MTSSKIPTKKHSRDTHVIRREDVKIPGILLVRNSDHFQVVALHYKRSAISFRTVT